VGRRPLLWAAVLAAPLVACVALAGDGNSPTVSASPSRSTTTQPPVASVTDSPEAIPTPRPTPIPTPVGAGLVQPPEFDAQFHASVADLPPGEYVVYVTGAFVARPWVYDFGYVGLQGRQRGALFTILARDHGLHAANNTDTLLLMAYEGEETEGVLLTDLLRDKLTQFDVGCIPAMISTIQNSSFYYRCLDQIGPDEDIVYFVSSQDWAARGYAFPPPPPGELNRILWLTDEKIIIQPRIGASSSMGSGGGDVARCLFTLPEGVLACMDEVPAWWAPTSSASPDGMSVAVRYREDPQDPRSWVAALATVACVEKPGPECVPQIIPGSSDLGPETAFIWSPDGQTLVMHDACGEGDRASPIWIYDLDLGQTSLLTDGAGCFDLGPGPWTADEEHLVMVDMNPSNNQTVWLLSTRTGEMRNVTAGIDGIVEVVGLFEVP
jgi:hypothetical protein